MALRWNALSCSTTGWSMRHGSWWHSLHGGNGSLLLPVSLCATCQGWAPGTAVARAGTTCREPRPSAPMVASWASMPKEIISGRQALPAASRLALAPWVLMLLGRRPVGALVPPKGHQPDHLPASCGDRLASPPGPRGTPQAARSSAGRRGTQAPSLCSSGSGSCGGVCGWGGVSECRRLGSSGAGQRPKAGTLIACWRLAAQGLDSRVGAVRVKCLALCLPIIAVCASGDPHLQVCGSVKVNN